MKKKFKSLGKFLPRLFCIGALLGGTACTDDDTAAVQRGETSPLQITVNTDKPASRAVITDEYLASGESIGVGLFTLDGDDYDGQEYANIKFTAAGDGVSQVWSAGNNTPAVSANEAHLLAYWPYNGDMESAALMPVETETQTDYMYSGLVTGISNAKPQADITLYHALTDIRVKLVLGNYTGDVAVSNISVSSPALGTAADCSVADGTLTDITGQGDAVALDVDFDMVAGGTDTDIMLVPDASVTTGTTTVAVTVGGKKYNAGIDFDAEYLQGYVYTYTLTLTNEGFEVTKITVYPWQEGDNDAAALKPEKDDTYVVKILASYEVTAPASLIEGEDVAYNNNISTVQSRSGDTFGFHHNIQGFIGTVDWGDGTKSTYDEETYNSITHVYPNDGKEYIITAKGTIHRLEMGEMVFQQCLKEIIHIGADCGITSFEKSFWGCVNLTTIPEGLFNKCTEVTSFAGTFAYCPGLKALPEGLFDKCTKVTSFYRTFAFCQNLQTVPVGLFDHCTKVLDFSDTFQECHALTGESPYTLVDGVKVHLYERANYPGQFIVPTDYGMCFSYCTKLTDYGSIPSGWK